MFGRGKKDSNTIDASEMLGKARHLVGTELKKLGQILKPGEVVEALLTGNLDKRVCLVAATSERVLVIEDSPGSHQIIAFPRGQLVGVRTGGFAARSMAIDGPARTVELTSVGPWDRVAAFQAAAAAI